MSMVITDQFYLNLLQQLIEDHKKQIFGFEADAVQKYAIKLLPRINPHPYSYGRILQIDFQQAHQAKSFQLYLKFRTRRDVVPVNYFNVYQQMAGNNDFMLKYYFYAVIDATDETLIAMELVPGQSLRNVVLSKLIFHRTPELADFYFQNGQNMHYFHRLQAAHGEKCIEALFEPIRAKLATANFFNPFEKEKIAANIAQIEKKLNPAIKFPLIHIHHDWTLRNILVQPNGRLKVIDLDLIEWDRAWGWHDLVYFLINHESQIKYWPLVSGKNLKTLWEHFWRGYFQADQNAGSAENQLLQILYLIKLEYWIDNHQFALLAYYHRGLGKRYTKLLKKSLLKGQYSLFSKKSVI
ncbi:aminoglycoside phosphotransferase family protein [candidate division KSB1 bacterium]|nr:aminoglycoside phosphotransferase family protein [candidate division KSB1 bacterium]